MLTKNLLSAIAVLGVAGCASFRPDAGFDEVGRLVGDRVGKEVLWRTGAEEDEKVTGRIREILSREVSIDDVVQVVLLNNLELQATYQDLGIAQAEVVQAGLLTNPSVSIERRFRGKAAEADVAQNFLDVFLIPLRQRVAGASFEAAKLRVSEDVVKHAFDARLAYISLQGDMQLLEMRRSIASASEASAEAARRIREAGNAQLIAVQNEELSAAEAKLELATAEGEIVQSREQLNRLMGLWGGDTAWTIGTRLPELPGDDGLPPRLESVAVESRLDLAAMRRELEAAAEGVGIARINAIIPDLTLMGHYEREPEGKITRGPSLAFPLPLFNWGRAGAGQARARFAQAERRYAGMAIDIRSQVRAAYARMTVARTKTLYYRDRVLPLQAATVEQTQLRYNGMFIGVFELLQAKRAQIETGKKYIESLRDYWSARTEVEVALGRQLPASAPSAAPSTSMADLGTPEQDTARDGSMHHHEK